MHDQDILVDDIRVRGFGKSHFVEEAFESEKEIEINSNDSPNPDSLTGE